MNRRRFLGLTSLGLAGLALPRGLLRPLPAGAEDFLSRLPVGEELDFDIAFWWFSRAGSVSLSLQRLSGDRGFLAQARGQTHGLIGLVTRFRSDRYRAFMAFDPQMGRLVPRRFEEEVIIGDDLFRAVRVFDHQAGKILYMRPKKNGAQTRIEDMPLPETCDYLTAYYNFRLGVYGPPSHGRLYVIPTMPNQGQKDILIRVSDLPETVRRRQREGVSYSYHGQCTLDPELLRSEEGLIHGWADENLIPRQGVLASVIFFGDITAQLVAQRKIPLETDATPYYPQDRKIPRNEWWGE